MVKLITKDDIIDLIYKTRIKGLSIFLSKLNFKGLLRTKGTFNSLPAVSSNWWSIPEVEQRWNKLITDNPKLDYKDYFVQNFLKEKKDLRLLSLGSGSCNQELELAKIPNFSEIICVDISENRLAEAKKYAKKLGLNNINLVCADMNKYDIPENYFDVIFFHASLHHFDNVETLLKNKINNGLKNSGLLIINEYVGPNRLQFPKSQIKKINEALNLIPKKHKQRYNSKSFKTKFYGSGILRMFITDPSECVDSESILPSIHQNFKTVVEKPFGGNILMNVLKDISHHFFEMNNEKEEILKNLFLFEDEYLKANPSDFIFGVYSKNTEH